jgi:hypothetical protein
MEKLALFLTGVKKQYFLFCKNSTNSSVLTEFVFISIKIIAANIVCDLWRLIASLKLIHATHSVPNITEYNNTL